MKINNCLDSLLAGNFGIESYTRNKSILFTIIEMIGKDDAKLSPESRTIAVKKVVQVLNKLKLNQKMIKIVRLGSKPASFYDSLQHKLQGVLHLFRKVFYGSHKLDDLIQRVEMFANRPSAIGKFRDVARKLMKNIAKGASLKGTVLLDKDYWMETLGMKLKIEGEIIEGHIYTGFLANQEKVQEKWKLLEKWKTGADEKGVPYQKQYSFETYLNEIVIPSLTKEEMSEFKAKMTIVEYYASEELTALEGHIDCSGKVYTASPRLNAWIEHQGNHPESTLSFKEFYPAVPHPNLKEAAEKHFLKDQTYIYVQDHQGRFYLHIKKRGLINHTSLSNGKAVLAAGGLKVKDGKIIEVDTFSGHYKPTVEQLKTFLKFLEKSGVDLDLIKVTYVADYSVQPWVIKSLKAGEVRHWLSSDGF